jgi:hypothetical protein
MKWLAIKMLSRYCSRTSLVEALYCKASASVFRDRMVGFYFIATQKHQVTEGGNRDVPWFLRAGLNKKVFYN